MVALPVPGPRRLGSERAGLLLLTAVAVISAAIYLLLTLAMSLDEFFPGPGETLDFQFMLGDDWVANSWFLYGSFAALFLLWGVALWAASRLPPTRRSVAVVTAGGLAMAAVLVPMYPPFAVDFFHYLGEGRLLWVEGENPMVRGPGEFFPIAMSYGNEPAAYGPLWYWTLAPPVLAGGDDFPRSLLILKAWMVGWGALAALLGALTARILSRRPDPSAPGRELLVAVAIGWNPYVLWRVAGNGHNDIVMMAFALLAVWLAVTAASRDATSEGTTPSWRWLWVPPALTASILVKYVSLLLVPVFAIYVLRRPPEARRTLLRPLAAGVALSLLLAVAAFAPMWEGLSVFDQVREQGDRVITSTPRLIAIAIRDWFDVGRDRADEIGLRVGAGLFLLAAAWLLWRQRAGAEALVAAAASLLLLYGLLGVGWFRPWYFLWVVTLAPLLPGRWWLAVAVATSIAGLAPDVAEKYAIRVDLLDSLIDLHSSLPAIVLQFLPPAIVWLAALWWTRRVTFDATPAVQPPRRATDTSRPARSAS